jgi:thiopeptide-type bacteriocin biosynthesis protein
MPAGLRPPGSEWLVLKLSCAPTVQEDLFAGPIHTCAHAQQQRLAADWFFMRSADPEPHIRLRFCGEPRQLMGQLMSEGSPRNLRSMSLNARSSALEGW